MTHWTADDIPDQSGRTAVITGANAGLGYQTAVALARKGARVVLACRSDDRGGDARRRICAEVADARVEVGALDLADLESVHSFADRMLQRDEGIDLLINNAGIMAVPTRQTTAQGFELQIGTNHLGHFALTGRLLPALLGGEDARIVTVSSFAHKRAGGIDFADLQRERRYSAWTAYNESKLANAMFVLELGRRLQPLDRGPLSVGAHPGFSSTNLQYSGPRMGGTGLMALGLGIVTRLMAQSDRQGALPQLYAATALGVQGGQYFGPSGIAELRGGPKARGFSKAAHDEAAAARLWQVSEELTGVSFGLPPK